MSEKLSSGLAPGVADGVEGRNEARILLDFIKNNWTLTDNLATDKVDWAGHPSRTIKAITINCYRIFSNVYDKDVGSHAYYFDVPVAVDVYVRDAPARGKKDDVDQPSPKLVQIDNYLRQFILVNRIGLRDKGVNNIMLSRVRYPDEPPDATGGDLVWKHMLAEVRLSYHMFRVPL